MRRKILFTIRTKNRKTWRLRDGEVFILSLAKWNEEEEDRKRCDKVQKIMRVESTWGINRNKRTLGRQNLQSNPKGAGKEESSGSSFKMLPKNSERLNRKEMRKKKRKEDEHVQFKKLPLATCQKIDLVDLSCPPSLFLPFNKFFLFFPRERGIMEQFRRLLGFYNRFCPIFDIWKPHFEKQNSHEKATKIQQ